MAKKKENSEQDEIKHIVRIANTDLEGKKSVQYSLTGIKGINRRIARIISDRSNVDPSATIGYLDDEKIDSLKKTIEEIKSILPTWMLNRRKDLMTGDDKHILATDILLTKREDLNTLKKTRSYRGVRHERGHKVRGQRTRSSGRRGLTVGVKRKPK
ncbi:MAG: 30S ribosomal protein S13 [ANME-2 cluster archaeon]|nr:30S ribosomal protein S13 [ANME-2 cluster archaeon]MBC2700390.1 30S ribosomal protein S13 [ANME-2 cluster archaeon]MBC2706587.1 30S ribosomal protein S13 [ANME-2 cluster archaeon]MBC2748029.1 30S ribosomal protein S13 [ANME-2 cluster archaeon]MBC2764199.1 30S ribosomal protein S13 [ANME-2 cluster archaeon]